MNAIQRLFPVTINMFVLQSMYGCSVKKKKKVLKLESKQFIHRNLVFYGGLTRVARTSQMTFYVHRPQNITI